ncbi:hypothetical protein H0A71_06015 [Alcaligenaceae bacterium]|nr:hypothetical protein [Alcaligenaceae bacterium]
MSKSLRDQMPETTAFIDSLREAFGAEMINEQIRKGLKGEATFYASENGHELGTPWMQGEENAKD